MRIPWLKGIPANWNAVKGKQLYLKSGSPPRAQAVIDGNAKAELRIVREPLFSAELYPPAGARRVDFFNTRQNNTTPNGLLLDESLTNLQQSNTIGEPEVFDLAGLAISFEHGMPSDELIALLNNGVLSFQFSASQPVLRVPLEQFPAATGLQGIGHLFETRDLQVGAPFASNVYDLTVNGYPRRIWSLETFSVFMEFGNTPPVLPAARVIRAYMVGVHYIR